ncbi:uncharacterized protein Z519_09216 [Cladophialophora bantiana CBS 173.52]|uniref:ABM domain-containing protein n=1 Tax=Cladophialophora bantiana (strain ATCC 10958 / CBS 173.52 / CDC B-1940 / NIH 8579) TaxID=1442370 RepID=A0A0D2I141_CLAB1|nr:uncharacterized protein Z519_09216 [Cladophialophora bantiana CBS 173.52]KIW90569.1 hypothetical protein Z519_09216 [Cladophialophora bantiana CBS 173.52]
MAILLLPTVSFATKEKQQRFFSLLQSVAEESWADEPDCLGYCWLVSVVPAELRVCGFELYSNAAALTEVHRAGTAYGRFKTALTQEELAPPPSRDDLRFWCPVLDPCPELNKSHGEDTPLTFLVSKYQLDSSERREALLKDFESEHGEAQSTTSATRIVATAPDSHDVVTVHIAHSTALDDLRCKKIEEQSRYVIRMLPLSALVIMYSCGLTQDARNGGARDLPSLADIFSRISSWKFCQGKFQ